MAEKLSRKELLKQEDAFLHAANQSAAWLKTHRRLVVSGVVAAVVLFGLVWGTLEFQRKSAGEASRLFVQATKLKTAEVVKEGADPKKDPPTFATDKERDEAALAAYLKVVEAAPSSGVADIARFAVADLETKLDKADAALQHFEELLRGLGKTDNLYFLAVERVAYLQEQKGDLEAARKSWRELPRGKDSFYGDRALYQEARITIEKGEADKAREILTQLEKDFPTTTLKDDVQVLWNVVGRPTPAPEVASGTPKQPEGQRNP